MTPKQLKEEVAKTAAMMSEDAKMNWFDLTLYLEQELQEGKQEFRISFQDDNRFIVHPLGKDGKTLDLKLYPDSKGGSK